MGVPIDITFTGFAVPFSASSAFSAPGLSPFVLPQRSLSVLGDLRGEIRAVIVSVPIDITFPGFARAASLQAPPALSEAEWGGAFERRSIAPMGLQGQRMKEKRFFRSATTGLRHVATIRRPRWGFMRLTDSCLRLSASSACSAPGLLPFVLPQGSLSVLGDLRGEIRAVVVSVPIDITFTGFARAASLQAPPALSEAEWGGAFERRSIAPMGLQRQRRREE
jgi:hypothetical protein